MSKAFRPFFLEDIVKIEATQSSIDKKNLSGIKGKYPYITRTANQNGWADFISAQSNYNTDSGNCITIGLDTQTAFYQPNDFYTGQNIQVLSSPRINKHVALFMIPLIKKQLEHLNWGGNGATLGRLKRTKIMLPVIQSSDGKIVTDKLGNPVPDYEYMENMSKTKECKIISRYKEYIESELSEMEKNCPKLINWKPFFIEDIFDIKPGIRLTKENMIEGNKPFIGSSAENNGITAFVSNENKSLDENILGVNYNGSVVENFYHPYKCIFSDDVKRFHLKNIENDKYVFLFIKNSILKQKVRFEYGYKFNEFHMRKTRIMLPAVKINDEFVPDYAYMKLSIKKMEHRQIKRYLIYLVNKA